MRNSDEDQLLGLSTQSAIRTCQGRELWIEWKRSMALEQGSNRAQKFAGGC